MEPFAEIAIRKKHVSEFATCSLVNIAHAVPAPSADIPALTRSGFMACPIPIAVASTNFQCLTEWKVKSWSPNADRHSTRRFFSPISATARRSVGTAEIRSCFHKATLRMRFPRPEEQSRADRYVRVSFCTTSGSSRPEFIPFCGV